MHIIITDICMVRKKFAFHQSLARKLKDFYNNFDFIFFKSDCNSYGNCKPI